jgi:hypothetical protein
MSCNQKQPEKKTETLSYKERNRNHITKPGQRIKNTTTVKLSCYAEEVKHGHSISLDGYDLQVAIKISNKKGEWLEAHNHIQPVPPSQGPSISGGFFAKVSAKL